MFRVRRAAAWSANAVPSMGAGLWRPLKRADGSPTAWISCPECGREATLQDHEISADGVAKPSVECPSCPWHQVVVLLDWPGEGGEVLAR